MTKFHHKVRAVEDYYYWDYEEGLQCTKKNEVLDCGYDCPRTCSNHKHLICNYACIRGCVCARGFVRDENWECIPIHLCPSS